MPACRMDDHAGGFVDDGNRGVFVENVERNWFRLGTDGWRRGQSEIDVLARFKTKSGFLGNAIDKRRAGVDATLDSHATGLRNLRGEADLLS